MATAYKFQGISRNPDQTIAREHRVEIFKTSDNSVIDSVETDADYGTFDVTVPDDSEAYIVFLYDDPTTHPIIFNAVDPKAEVT